MSPASSLAGTADSAAPPPRFDFPTWLAPMLVKELRQGLRTRGFVGSMVGFHALMVIALVWSFAIDIGGSQRQALNTINGIFWTLLSVLLLAVTPLRALFGLSSEVNARTIDLLMLTRLTAWRVVQGKWVSLMAQATLLVVAMLPYGLIRYFFGSVDLINDLAIIGYLLLGCAVITALALWLSALPRIVRFILPIGCLFLVPSLGQVFFYRSNIGFFFTRSGSGGPDFWLAIASLLLNAAVLLAFCLLQAVRRIAPPAENHAPATRLIALVPLLPAAALFAFDWKELARAQFALAMMALLLVCVMELANLHLPMATHVRTWWKRGTASAWFGRLVLPGWPSAAAFAFVAVGLLVAMAAWTRFPSATHTFRFVWGLALAWPALVFPMVLLSFIPSATRQAPGLYFILQAIFGILSLVAANNPTERLINPVSQFFANVCQVMPVSSFWLTISEAHRPIPDTIFPAQAAMLAVVLGLVIWRGRAYWQGVRLHVFTIRSPAA